MGQPCTNCIDATKLGCGPSTSDNVTYTGPNLPCSTINTTDTLTLAFQKIDALLCNVPGGQDLQQTLINGNISTDNPALFETAANTNLTTISFNGITVEDDIKYVSYTKEGIFFSINGTTIKPASPGAGGVNLLIPTLSPGTYTIATVNQIPNDANLLHKTGDEIKTGNLTVNAIIKAGGNGMEYLMADGSTSTIIGIITSILTPNILDGDLTHAPNGNAVYDALLLKADDNNVIHKIGNEIKVGSLTVTSIIKAGGTASQFLKADGSIDSSIYLVAADISGKENKSEKNQINGYAGLGSDGKLFSSQLPPLAITDTFVVNSQANMLALSTAETGDIAVRTDINQTFILKGSDYSILSDWQVLLSPTDVVTSVFGRTGPVVANFGDYDTSLVPDTLNKRYVTDANLTTIGNQSGINTGDNSVNTNSNAYADSKVEDLIVDGEITKAPSQNAVFDALDIKTGNSAGANQGFAITNNGDGTVNIATGIAYLRATNDQYAALLKYTIPAVTNLALTDNANNYILVDYNGGNPAITVTTNSSTINTETNSLLALISRVGTTLDYLSLVGQNNDANAKIRVRFLNQEGIRRANGTIIGFINRNLTLTAGTLFSGLIRINSPAFNTVSPDTFTYVYNNGAVWTRVPGQTQVNNTQYNNAGVLTTMPNNDFRVDYIYLLPNNPSKLYVVYGTTTYNSITLARLAPAPTALPTELQVIGLLVGRQIIEKNAATISEVSSAFADVFTTTGVPEHNALAGIQGGAVNDYQHFTTAEKNDIIHKTLNETKTGTLTTYGSNITDNTYTFKQYLAPIRNNSSGFYNQPFFASDLGWYIFRSETPDTPSRFYIMPNGTTSSTPVGLTSKFEMFNTDFSQDYTAYTGFNILCENVNNTVSLSPNRGSGGGTRMKMRFLGDMTGSQFFDNASSIDFETNNDIMINRYAGAVSFGSNTTDPFSLAIANQFTFKNSAATATRVNIVGNGTTGGLYFGRDAIRTIALESLLTTSDFAISLNATNTGTILSKYATFFGSSGNLLLQNAGTHTDNGFRLDNNGTTRLQSTVTLGTAPTTSAGSYDILTRNTSTGVIEKILSTSIVSGTGTAGQVSFWTGANTQSGDSGLVYDSSTNILTSINNGSYRVTKFINGTTASPNYEPIATYGFGTAFGTGMYGGNSLTSNNGMFLKFVVNSTTALNTLIDAMILNSSGQVVLPISDARIIGGDNVGRLLLTNNSVTSYIGLNGSTHATPNEIQMVTTTGNIRMLTNSLERFTILNNGNTGIGSNNPIGKLDIFTGLTGLIGNMATMPNGTISFGNGTASAALPTIFSKSNDSIGLRIIAGTNDVNSAPDMALDVRRNDNNDFTVLTTPAFRFSRNTNTLIEVLRNGNTTFNNSSVDTYASSSGVLATPPTQYLFANGGATDNTFSLLRFSASRSGGQSAITYIGTLNTSVNTESIFVIGRRTGATSYAESLRIHATGGVSIGNTTDPGAANLNVTGNIGAGITPSGTRVHVAASTTILSAIRLTVGVAPTAPNDGDIWLESNTLTGLKIRIGGVTRTVTLT